jgi:hypothetical protein
MENTPTTNTSAPVVLPKLPGVFALLKSSWEFYKKHWLTLLGIALLPALLSIIFALGAVLLVTLNLTSVGLLVGIPFALVLILAFLLSPLAQLLFVTHAYQGENLKVFEAYRRSFPSFLSYLWVVILAGLVNMGGFILLIVPGIYFLILTAFSLFIWADEGKKGVSALTSSWNYASGYWWVLLGRSLGTLLIVIIPYFIIISLLGLISERLTDIIHPLLNYGILSPFILVISLHLYRALKQVKSAPAQAVVDQTKEKTRRRWLVGFAILGLFVIPLILGSIVLTSLSTAREKAREAFDRANQIEESYPSATQQP